MSCNHEDVQEIGPTCGMAGSNEVEVLCPDCGHRAWAGYNREDPDAHFLQGEAWTRARDEFWAPTKSA